jgi:hypothetical protein
MEIPSANPLANKTNNSIGCDMAQNPKTKSKIIRKHEFFSEYMKTLRKVDVGAV